MDYSMIALDVDGTLLNDDHELTEATKRAVRDAHAQGAKIVLCTGRGPANAIPVLEELGLDGVLITHNGAATVQVPGGRVLHEYGFEPQQVSGLISYCRESGIHFDVCTAYEMFAEAIGATAAAMYGKFMLMPHTIPDVLRLGQSIVKFTLFGTPEEMDKAEQDFARLQPEGLHALRSGDSFIDVMSTAASKGKAVQQLAEQWQVPRERIMAIGNYYNDVEMLQYAGLGIAMDNAPEAVKRAADAVTSSNNEDGVAAAFAKYGLHTPQH